MGNKNDLSEAIKGFSTCDLIQFHNFLCEAVRCNLSVEDIKAFLNAEVDARDNAILLRFENDELH